MESQEIRELAEYYKDDYYSALRTEQKTDLTYYDDTFKVPWITSTKKIRRTGRGARMIDSPIEHIVTNNPVGYYQKRLEADNKRELRVNTELNRWIQYIKRDNPNRFKGHGKNNLNYGEAWIQIAHNASWVVKPIDRRGIPVHFLLPNPLTLYASPKEVGGIPEHVLVYYERSPLVLAQIYPQWSVARGKMTAKEIKKKRQFLCYIDEKQWYVEIDKEVVKNEKNIYGFVPFVHSLSGFGSGSPDAEVKDIVVGRLRKSRHILERECGLISDIDSSIHMFSNPQKVFKVTDRDVETPPDFAKEYNKAPDLAYQLPFGIDSVWEDRPVPEAQVFQYYNTIAAELEREDPMVMAGMPIGESGRLQDIVQMSAMRRYDSVAESTEIAFSTAFGMALRLCDDAKNGGIPTLRPDSLKVGDIGKEYDCRVELKAADPIEADRKATLGSRLYQQKEIDLRTNLVEYQGKKPEAAEEIIVQMIVDDTTINSPVIRELIARRAMEKMGMEEEIEAQQMMGQQEGMTATAQQRAQGEVQTQMGREMTDQSLQKEGMRSPGTRYVRSGGQVA